MPSDAELGNPGVGDRQPSREAVQEQLERILASEEFVAPDRLKSFLRFVVEEALAGRAERLKAYTIAVDVFGRDESFDPQSDPVVRMEAGKLRRRLELYYLGAGARDPVRVEIPKGAYAPMFLLHDAGVGAKGAAVGRASGSRRRIAGNALWGLGGALAVGLIILATAWLRSEAPTPEAEAGLPTAQGRGPAVIVLPFENLSQNDADDFFAAGLTEELISNLMGFGELRLYSAYGSFQEQPTADPVELSGRLDVGYVIKGSVRRDAQQMRLIVHLIEARTGKHLWTRTYDRALTPENVFAVQEQLAADLGSRLAQPYGIINEVTAESFRQQRPETLVAYDCVLRTFDYRRTLDRERYAASRACLEEAVRRDPRYADAWAYLAFAYLDEYRYGYGPRAGDASMLDLTLDTARRAVELDESSVYGLLALSAVQFYRGDRDEAEEIHRRLLSLYPTNPEVLAQVGWRTAFFGDWDEGVDLLERAVTRSITAPNWYHLHIVLDHYRRRDYRAALAELDRLAYAEDIWALVLSAASHAQLDSKEEARRALDRAEALNPRFLQDPRGAMRIHHFPEDVIDQLIDGLRKAGLEVHAASKDA